MKTSLSIKREGKIVSSEWLTPAAYKRAVQLTYAHNGDIFCNPHPRQFQAKFLSIKDAKAMVEEWQADYERAHAAYVARQEAERAETLRKLGEAEKPKTKTPKTSKKSGIDFSKVKGATKSERNKAAHALIVGMGIKSGSEEYATLWKKWQSVR